MANLAVIDTGICNLRSVTKAIEVVGGHPVVVRSSAEIEDCAPAGLVLPGVGALRDCVAALRQQALEPLLRDWISRDRPFLGVCLGMQALFDHSEEGDIAGLGIFPGRVRRFRLPPEFKIPHMGWNSVHFRPAAGALSRGLRARDETFYFVHSYHCVPADPDLILGECDYGGPFAAAIGRGRCFATQFHPEKSQARGLQVYGNFVALAEAA